MKRWMCVEKSTMGPYMLVQSDGDYVRYEDVLSLLAENSAMKYSIKLITGLIPLDMNKFIAALEAYGVEVDPASTRQEPDEKGQ